MYSKISRNSEKFRYFSSHKDIIFQNKERQNLRNLRDLIDYFQNKKIPINSIKKILNYDYGNFGIPITVFSAKLSPLEALVKFLKEDVGLNFHQIGKLLNRDEKGLWHSYNCVKNKKIAFSDSEILIPVQLFYNRQFSILENIVFYLSKKYKLSPYRIAKLLSKSAGPVQTVYYRLKKKLEKEPISFADSLINISLLRNKKYLELEKIANKLDEKYGYSLDYVLNAAENIDRYEGKKIEIPLEIFNKNLAPQEVLVKFLHDNLFFSLKEISELLRKSYSSVYLTYFNSLKKYDGKIIVKDFSEKIPLNVFCQERFSILESVVGYLDSMNFSNNQISILLKRDPRTIWTIKSRYRIKSNKRLNAQE